MRRSDAFDPSVLNRPRRMTEDMTNYLENLVLRLELD